MKETVYSFAAGCRAELALLADLHNEKPARALRCLTQRRPDAILFAGDLFRGHRPVRGGDLFAKQTQVLPFLSACAQIAPTFLSLGNHEWLLRAEDLQRLAETGATVLDNRFVTQGALVIGGLTSALTTVYRQRAMSENGMEMPPRRRRADSRVFQPETAWLDAFEQQPGYKILLCHHPEYWSLRPPMLWERKIDLVLAGHAHGGQIRLLGQGLLSPGQGWFPQLTSGVHPGAYGQLVISRGLANTGRPIPRLFNPRETVRIVLTDRPADAEKEKA